MGRGLTVAVILTGLLVAGCGSNDPAAVPAVSASEQATTPALMATQETGVTIGTVVPLGAVTTSASALVTPGKGGKVRVDLGEGAQATLTVPAGAVAEEVVVTLRAFRSGSHQGLLMEPDGLWLTKPAALTVTGDPTLLLRIGAQTNGNLYTPTSTDGAGTVWVVRLRPVLVADEEVTPTVLGPDWVGPQPPGADGELPQTDPADGKAAQEEAKEAESADGEVDDSEGAQSLAAQWVAPLEARCSDPNDPARQRVVATRTTAGAKAPVELPECITRAITVLGLYEMDAKGEQGKILNSEETVAGETELSNEFEEYRFPLEGEVDGVDSGTSYLLSAMVYGMDQMIGGLGNAKEPTGDRCSVTSLENGRMSGKLEVTASDQLKVTLQPLSGTYTISCGGKPIIHEMGVWKLVRLLKNMGDDEPFIFTFDKGQRTSNIYSNFQALEQMGAKLLPDGRMRIGDSEMRLHSLMVVSIYESLKELEEERRKATESPSPKATK
ncbi:MAG: hypothetical protein KGN78_08450 [Actinomycetales bacterium]|nr:hypothetical protein [Actinomycetales bacterium]